MAARAGVEPTTLRLKVIASTNAPPCPTCATMSHMRHHVPQGHGGACGTWWRIVNKDLSSSTSFNTSFDMCSVQLIFSVLRHILISKASNLVMSSFLRVHVSAQYKVALQISVFTILFLRHL